MQSYHSIRKPLSAKSPELDWKKGDVLVLFGELFQRGYANGLVEAAEKRGMTVIHSTVGRREKDGSLRGLTTEEMAEKGKPFLNVPLEAGFDMEIVQDGKSLVDILKDVKMTDWESFQIDRSLIQKARQLGRERFRGQVRNYFAELEKMIPSNANVHIAHLMAGGVPRARILMPIMNRVFKGTDERFMESKAFWATDIGHLCSESFSAVTGETLEVLLDESTGFRKKRETAGLHVSYSGYGYHGTEVLFGGEFKWQSYAPYLQGWAKMELENIAKKAFAEGVKAAVYNCPEILTNSSAIFQGVEIPLYPLLKMIQKEAPTSPKFKKIWDECQSLLKEGESVDSVLSICDRVLTHPSVVARSKFPNWPEHNEKSQMEALLQGSTEIFAKHISDKNLMTATLSEIVFQACGDTMLQDMRSPESPVNWLNHDLVARHYVEKQ